MIQLHSLSLQAFGCYAQGVVLDFAQAQGIAVTQNFTTEQLQCVCDAITYAVQGNLDGNLPCAQMQENACAQLTLSNGQGKYRLTATTATHQVEVCQGEQGMWEQTEQSLAEILGMLPADFLRQVLCSWEAVQQELRRNGGDFVMQQQNLLYVSGYETMQQVQAELQTCLDKLQDLSAKNKIIVTEMEQAQTELQNGLYRITLHEQQVKLQQEQTEIEEIRAYLNHLASKKLQERLQSFDLDWEEQEDMNFLLQQQIEDALRLQTSLEEDVARAHTALVQKQKMLEKRGKLEIMIANYHYVKECRDTLAREMGECVLLSQQREELLSEYAALTTQTEQALYDYSRTYQYELARALKKGEPCPVCGSTEHPRKRRKPRPLFDFLDLTDHLKVLHRVDLHIMAIDEQIEKYELRDIAERRRLEAYCTLEYTSLSKLKQDLADCKREENMTERLCAHIHAQQQSLHQNTEQITALQQRQEETQQKLGELTARKDALEAELERFQQMQCPQPSYTQLQEYTKQSLEALTERVQDFDAKCKTLTTQLQACATRHTTDFKALQDKIHYLQAQQLVIAHENATQMQTKQQLSDLWQRLENTQNDAPPSLYKSNHLLAHICDYQFVWGTLGPLVASANGSQQVWDGLTWQNRQQLAMAWVLGKAQVTPLLLQEDWQIAEVCPLLEQSQTAAVLCTCAPATISAIATKLTAQPPCDKA